MLNDAWDPNKCGQAFQIKGADAIKTAFGAGSIQGIKKLSNRGKLNSLYYVEYTLSKNS